MTSYYFGYCTWLDEPEARRFIPTAHFVTKASAANHTIAFHAAGASKDRGWCHFSNGPDARGLDTLGLVYEVPDGEAHLDYDDFERCFVTVHGDDGITYDCYTYRLVAPGIRMRPPQFYWDHIPKGLRAWDFPAEYTNRVLEVYNRAAPCPRADRPAPSGPPTADPASR